MTTLEAVFHDRSEAERAADALRGHGAEVRVGEERDHVAALRGEMRDEIEGVVAGPGNVGPFTKGMNQGIVRWTPLGAVAGTLLFLPLGLIGWGGFGADRWSLPARLLIAAVVGAALGSTVGFVAGGLSGSWRRHEGERMAAEEGITLAIRLGADADAIEVREALEEHGAIRIFQVDDDGRPETASSERQQRPISED